MEGSSVRVDRWLAAARLFRSRTQATEACGEGRVSVNGERADADRPVRIGDRLVVKRHAGDRVLEIAALGEKRLGPALARGLYVDHTPAPPEEPPAVVRDRGTGRPTKQDRRALRKIFGELD